MTPALAGARPVLEDCWCRRYRCTACKGVATVLPAGVMPRFLYSALAIVVAFVLVAPKPIGDDLNHADAYDQQGMNPRRDWNIRSAAYRWRSVDRWAAHIAEWWPGSPDGVESLLVGLYRRAGSTDRRALLAAATASHVRWGAAM